jgi:hypothetical protein
VGSRHERPADASNAGAPHVEPVAHRGSAGARAVLLVIGLGLVAGAALVERWREDAPSDAAGVGQPGIAQSPPVSATRPPTASASRPSPPSALPGRPRATFDAADARAGALREAVGPAAAAAGEWGVGGLVSPLRAQPPGSAPLDPALLGPTCDGGRLLTTEQVVVVGYRGRRPSGASVIRLTSGEQQLEVDAIIELDAVDGAVLLAPRGDRVWRPGYYTVQLERPFRSTKRAQFRRLVFCVGMYEPNGQLVVPPSLLTPNSD